MWGSDTIAQCFPDPNLAGVVADAMNKKVADVPTQADYDAVGQIFAGSKGITNLQRLDSKFTKLDRLSLANNNISDLSSLEGNLPSLTYLNFLNNQITDIGPLAKMKMPNLLDLELGNDDNNPNPTGNHITDVSPLKNLTKLRFLGLGDNKLTDLPQGLASLISLKTLAPYSNQISDISILKNLINLSDLKIFDNQISDVSPCRT